MPLWSQHLLVLLVALGCAAFIARQVFLSLQGRRSKLNACGSCKSCAPPADAAKPAGTRLVIFPADLLRKRR